MKKKKKKSNELLLQFFFYGSDIKFFLKSSINKCHKSIG